MGSNLKIPAGFDAATSEERIAFVQELWDRIAANPEKVPVPQEHRRILDERLANYRAAPESGRAWSEVRDELLAKIRGA